MQYIAAQPGKALPAPWTSVLFRPSAGAWRHLTSKNVLTFSPTRPSSPGLVASATLSTICRVARRRRWRPRYGPVTNRPKNELGNLLQATDEPQWRPMIPQILFGSIL